MCRRREPGELAAIGGAALFAVGFTGFVLALVTDLSLAGAGSVALLLAGGQAMIMGMLLVLYHRLMMKTTANEQALLFQYDIGYEAGYQERAKMAARPVVVDFEARREMARK